MTEQERLARHIVEKWIWDCGGSLSLSFVESELLQQRIIESVTDVVEKLERERDTAHRRYLDASRRAHTYRQERDGARQASQHTPTHEGGGK